MPPPEFESGSQAPQACILSTRLRGPTPYFNSLSAPGAIRTRDSRLSPFNIVRRPMPYPD